MAGKLIKIDSILKWILAEIKPSEQELKIIQEKVDRFLKELKERLEELKINAEIFIGGSFAKDTLIKKDHYDVDVFLRFGKEYENEEISKLALEALIGFEGVSIIHGSRDYFRIKLGQDNYVELIPVKKIKNSKEAENITDLSYSHVQYINKKIKTGKVRDEIKIAKAFCHANGVYGAESYVNGFSGYALELLVYYYGSFLKFISAMEKADKKIIIDIEKHYKNKQNIMMDINSAKLKSPVILIDPTYKQRNALAALSEETFEKFRKICRSFLKKPSIEFFRIKEMDIEKIKKDAKKTKSEFILLEAKTNKQPGDIAGSKLLKFYNHLEEEIGKLFAVKDKGFEYKDKQNARFFFVVKKKKERILAGPKINDKYNVMKFKQRHKNTFAKKGRVYAKEKTALNLKEFIDFWKKKNSKKMKEMSISGLRIVD